MTSIEIEPINCYAMGFTNAVSGDGQDEVPTQSKIRKTFGQNCNNKQYGDLWGRLTWQ